MALVSSYLKGSVTRREMAAAADEAAAGLGVSQAVSGLQHRVPEYVVSLLGEKSAQPGMAGVTPELVQKAVETLNEMMETAQQEYDLKDMECRAFEERNRAEYGQTRKDLSRLGEAISANNALILESKGAISEALVALQQVKTNAKVTDGAYLETKAINQGRMAILQEDLAVAAFIVKMTECKGGSFLQFPKEGVSVEQCPMHGGGNDIHFKEGLLKEKARKLMSPEARQALTAALMNSAKKWPHQTQVGLITRHVQMPDVPVPEGEGEGALEAELAPKVPPGMEAEVVPAAKGPDPEKAAQKCTLGKPDCGLLTDNMAKMWGEIKDQVDRLKAEMADNAANHAAAMGLHNQEISTLGSAVQAKNVELSESTGALSVNTEEQSERIAEEKMLEKEYDTVFGECKAVLHEILFVNICGAKTVRGEIVKRFETDLGYAPTDVLDCLVTEWIEQPCLNVINSAPQECIPQAICDNVDPKLGPIDPVCSGGVQNMTRNVFQETSRGSGCPALLLQKSCGMMDCPVDCVMSDWSPWGKCSKECGGGVQQKSRNVVTRADNGGESCPASSEAQSCNVQSCDVDCLLATWSPWSPCSRACNAGTQERVREIDAPAEGNGFCFAAGSQDRWESQDCNVQFCPPAPLCDAVQDVVIAVDVSGSLKQEGFDTLKAFVANYSWLYNMDPGTAKAPAGARIGIVEYSGEGKIVLPLADNPGAVEKAAAALAFQRNLTDMAVGISLAQTVLMEGRKEAQSVVIVLTDGKPSFQFATKNAADKLRASGARLVIVPVYQYGNPDFVRSLASHPKRDNVVEIPGLDYLAGNIGAEQINLMTATCSMLQQEKGSEEPPSLQKVLTDVYRQQREQMRMKSRHLRSGRYRDEFD